jgi:intein/homing endonuclease
MKKVLLKIEKLKVKANEKEILKGIDLKINSREIQALLGPNASGKSVDGNQRIILLDSLTNQIWYPKISMFIDRVINSLKTHGSNSSGAKFLKKRYFTLALNPITQKVKLYPITSVLRHRNAETLLKITTRTGRDIIVTKDHSLYTLKGVNVIPVESNSLKEGDYIVVAKKLNFDLKLPKTIDILNYFKNNQKIFVKVDERLSEKLVEKFPYLKRSWWYYSGHRKIPISLFLDLIEETKVKLKIHNHIRVGFKQGLLIAPKIPLNGEFARLLGYFIAEGNYSKEYRDGQISNTKKEIKEDIKMCLKNVFGIEKVRYKKRGSAIFFPKIIAFVFHKIFNLPVPCCAENKFIPKIILGSDKLLSSFLRAYFSGNGEVNVAKRYVSCSTKSKDLVDHLIVALLKFGIFSMVDTKTNKKYGQYHTLTIYGDYLKQFRDK